MNKAILFNFDVDKVNNRIEVKRSFAAPLDLVWAAWTDASILDLWWAPKPWRAKTKSMNFTKGGRWHYCMISPDGKESQWCLFDYTTITPEKSFSGIDSFCDENEVLNDTKPRVVWHNTFAPADADNTMVNITLEFKTLADLETIISMGMKEGFTMGLQNLDEYIKAQFYLRRQKKSGNRARVCTYLNFDGNTEEAMNFYRSIFKTEFVNGMQRFKDISPETGHPPVADSIKDMILHVELPLLGGHILMATDAPKEMGFTLTTGNNMHISLEPESREETERIFNALAQDGNITMPLKDMFFGAYYGSLTDKYGINWMVNHQNAS